MSRWASVSASVRSLTATHSMSAPGGLGGAEDVAADAAEAVDPHAYGHADGLLSGVDARSARRGAVDGQAISGQLRARASRARRPLSMSRCATVDVEVVAARGSARRGARRSPPSGGGRRCSRSRSRGAPCPPRRTAGSRKSSSGTSALVELVERARRARCTRRRAGRGRSARAARARSAGWAGSARRSTRSASRGGPCLKPKLWNVTARRAGAWRGRNSSAISPAQRRAPSGPVVSIDEVGALAQRLEQRALGGDARRRRCPSGASGWRRRVSL